MNPLADAIPSQGWLAARAHRRLLVVSTYTGLILGAVGDIFARWNSGSGLPALSMAGLLFFAGAAGSLVLVVRFSQGARDPQIDERQRAVRDRSYRLAYQVLIAGYCIILFGVSFLQLAFEYDLVAGLASSSTTVMSFLLILLMTLPSAMAAWSEPDPPEHE